jgi:hypothetical protein
MENKPQPKRPYNRKKQKQVKSSTVSDEYKLSDSLINFEESPSVSSTLVNNASNSNPSLSSSKLSMSSLSQNVTLIKRPKKGLATPKQRIAKKLKMTTNRFNSFSN